MMMSVRYQDFVHRQPPQAIPTTHRLEGERALCLAVLQQAIEYLFDPLRIWADSSKPVGVGTQAWVRHQLSMERDWFVAKDPRPFSFARVCEALNFDPDVLREELAHRGALDGEFILGALRRGRRRSLQAVGKAA